MKKLTENMRAVLRKVRGKAAGVPAGDLDERTLVALERRGLVRVEFVNATTSKGRQLGTRRMVFGVVKSTTPKMSDTYGKRITLRAGVWLRDGTDWDSRCVQRVHRTLEVIGEWGDFGYEIPSGGRALYADDEAVLDVNDFPGLRRYTFAEASEANTNSVTCRHCGEWLKGGDLGYGTEYGHCGCEDQSN